MREFLDYEGLRHLVTEQDKKYVIKGWATEAITEGAIHGLFVETTEGGLKYNGSVGDFTLEGVSETSELQVEAGRITLSGSADATNIKVLGLEAATLTIGESQYSLGAAEEDSARSLVKMEE